LQGASLIMLANLFESKGDIEKAIYYLKEMIRRYEDGEILHDDSYKSAIYNLFLIYSKEEYTEENLMLASKLMNLVYKE